MTPADEATFCALWQQGLSQDAIAQRLGIPIGSPRHKILYLSGERSRPDVDMDDDRLTGSPRRPGREEQGGWSGRAPGPSSG
jgi:hypothetical protein